ncbi:MAG: hypothetical protein NVS1B2_00560 [Vulcanimicrobiaceae bacterium]
MNRWFTIVALVAIVVGAALRFDRLDGKLFTNDEATTSVHVSGHTVAQYLDAMRAGRLHTVADALVFQHVDPTTTYADVVSTLAVEDPQHPPLFYVLERATQSLLGDGIAARRVLAAIFGVAAIGCAYWFGLTLLRSRPFALAFAALVAVSPFHEIYAQQSREYSLWTALVLVASAFLVRALRASTPRAWAWYALAVALGLYTDLLFAYTLIAHAAFVAIAYGRDVRRAVVPFVCAAAAAIAAFAPWIAALYAGRLLITNNAYLSTPLAAKLFALKWIFNIGAVFYDLDYVVHASVVVLVPIFAVLVWGLVLLVRRAERASIVLVLSLLAIPALAMLFPDFVRHESRSTSARYLVPTWLACEVAVAFALATLLASAHARRRAGAVATLAAFAVAGIGSTAVGLQHDYWWADASIAGIGPIARIVRATPEPVRVVFADDHTTWDFSPILLADAVSPSVGLVLLRKGQTFQHDARGATVYALNPTETFRASLARSGWREDLAYEARTSDAALASLQREAARGRARAGFVGVDMSLWRLH